MAPSISPKSAVDREGLSVEGDGAVFGDAGFPAFGKLQADFEVLGDYRQKEQESIRFNLKTAAEEWNRVERLKG